MKINPRVGLLALDSCHSEQIRAWRNEYPIWKWCRQYTLISDLQQDRWFERQDMDPTIRMFAVVDNGDLAGVCGFTDIDLINRRAEFSLYIAPDCQGDGVGRSALILLFNHGFNQFGFNRIWGETYDGNKASELFKKIGMELEGTRKDFYFREGRFIDAHLYSIGVEKWKSYGFSGEWLSRWPLNG